MFFSIPNKYKLDLDLLKIRVLLRAKQLIFLFSFCETENEIEAYLIKNYNIWLRTACMQIIYHGKFMTNSLGELIFVIQDNYWDKIASIITYGPDGLCGSNILREALKN